MQADTRLPTQSTKRQVRPGAPADLQKMRKTWCLFALQIKLEDPVLFALFNQFITGLLGKGRKILQCPRISGLNTQNLARLHFSQRLLGPQDGERTIQTLDVKIAIKFHNNSLPHFQF